MPNISLEIYNIFTIVNIVKSNITLIIINKYQRLDVKFFLLNLSESNFILIKINKYQLLRKKLALALLIEK